MELVSRWFSIVVAHFWQEDAVAVNHVDPDGGTLGVGAHPPQWLLNALGSDDGVGVEDECEVASSHGNGLIIGASKAHVALVLDKQDIGEAWLDEVHGVIGRAVVDNNYLALEATQCLLGGPDGLLKEVLGAIAYYDNRNVQIGDLFSVKLYNDNYGGLLP